MKNSLNLKLSKIVSSLLVILPLLVNAQFSKPEEEFSSDNERYIYPVLPGQPGSIAGTMGELRSTHFHSGIDIRTNNMIGFPVLASKSGYISRISVSASGYGNVIYITHPDGNTTLYAHLDKFNGPVANYVLEEQYRRRSSEIDLFFHQDHFPVKQGETIALSGNTGGSSGPHLHFETRDRNNHALDPLKVGGFAELVDKFPPAAEKIALRTLDINSRINDRFGRFEFYAQRSGNDYLIPHAILACGNIGVEIIAKDKLSSQSQFYGGVNFIEMSVDSQLVFKQAIDKVNIAETRAIYTLMDFKTMRNKGTRFYKLYIEDGNDLEFYKNSPGSGKISVNPAKESLVQIKMKDSDGNSSLMKFRLKPSVPISTVMSLEAYSSDLGFEISENTMMITAKPCKTSENRAIIYTGGKTNEVEPDYYNNHRSVYLWDLRKSIPDSIAVCSRTVEPKIKISIPSATEYKYYSDLMDIQFPMNAIYDTLYLNTDYATDQSGSELFTIGSRMIPLRKAISVSLKPQKIYPRQRDIAVYRVVGKSYYYVGGEWINGRVNFNTREFGDFTIRKDSQPPTITPLSVTRQGARFKITDDLSGIYKFEANINGQWLLMLRDAKTNTIWSKSLDPTVPLSGNFELVVTDNAGNKSRYSKKIL